MGEEDSAAGTRRGKKKIELSEQCFDEMEGFGTSDGSGPRTEVSRNYVLFPTSPKMTYFETSEQKHDFSQNGNYASESTKLAPIATE